MNCTICEKHLTGGLDTYGLPGQERCFDCHFAPATPEEDKVLNALLEEVQDAKSEVEQCEWDLIDATEQGDDTWREWASLNDSRTRLDDLLDMVKAHGKSAEREAKRKLERWKQFAGGVA